MLRSIDKQSGESALAYNNNANTSRTLRYRAAFSIWNQPRNHASQILTFA